VSKVFGQDPFLALLGSRIFFGSCSRAPSSSQVARSQILEWSSLSHAGALAAFLGSIFVGCSQFSSRVPSLLVWFRFQFHASILQRFSSSTDLSSLGGSEGSKCMPFWFAVLRFTLPPLQFLVLLVNRIRSRLWFLLGVLLWVVCASALFLTRQIKVSSFYSLHRVLVLISQTHHMVSDEMLVRK
jgi:hypothetical protein